MPKRNYSNALEFVHVPLNTLRLELDLVCYEGMPMWEQRAKWLLRDPCVRMGHIAICCLADGVSPCIQSQ